MKSTTLMLDIFDLLLVKTSTSKKMIGPWGQKLAILHNRALASFASLRCASSIVKADPEHLDLFSYIILWEPDAEILQSTLASINRGGKLVVFTTIPIKHFRTVQQNSRAMFAPVEKITIKQNQGQLFYITVYSLRANKPKEIALTVEQLHRSVGRIKFDNVLKREYNDSGNLLPVPTWNNLIRGMFRTECPDFFEEKED